jgi:hypothetical protein
MYLNKESNPFNNHSVISAKDISLTFVIFAFAVVAATVSTSYTAALIEGIL